MPSSHTQFKVAQLFKAIIDGEKQLETYRQVLSEQLKLDPFCLFRRIGMNAQGFVLPSSISKFLAYILEHI